MADFPDVPDAPGVPAVPRDPNAVFGAVVNLVADVINLLGFGTGTGWGLYLDGELAIEADSVQVFGFKKTFATPSYPIEEGGFQNYNKVQRPFTPRIRLATNGTVADRTAFLQQIDAAVSSINLYDVVTPEATYESVSLNGYSYDKTAMRGNGMLSVDIECQEIRQSASSAFTANSQNASTSTSASNSDDFIGTASPAGQVQSSEIANISSPQVAQAQPLANGGNVQPQAVGLTSLTKDQFDYRFGFVNF